MTSEELLLKMDAKLDKLQEDVTEIRIVQARHEEKLASNTESLVEHVHRTNLLEESQEVLYDQVTAIKLHASQFSAIWKSVGVISTILGLIAGFLKFFGKF